MHFLAKAPQDRPFDVVGLGLNAVDILCVVEHLPAYDTKLKMLERHMEAGGQAATAMVACTRWGLTTRYVGSFGAGWHGTYSKESLLREGVDVTHTTRPAGSRNQLAFIMIHATTGERTIVWDRDPLLAIDPDSFAAEAVSEGRALLLDGHDVEAAIRAATLARADGIPVVLDAETVTEGTGRLLGLSTFIIGSREFAGQLAPGAGLEEVLKILSDMGPELACITCGKEGSIAMHGGRLIRSPGYRIDTKDTTGAGDIFHAGFTYAFLNGRDVETTLAFSNAAAALSCRALGGRAAIPTVDEALEVMKGQEEGKKN